MLKKPAAAVLKRPASAKAALKKPAAAHTVFVSRDTVLVEQKMRIEMMEMQFQASMMRRPEMPQPHRPPTSSLKESLYVLNEANADLLQFDFYHIHGGLDMFIADKNFFNKDRLLPSPGSKQLWKLRIREKDERNGDNEDDTHAGYIQHATFVRWMSPLEVRLVKRGVW